MARHPALTVEQRLAIVRQSDKAPEWKQKQLGEWAADTFQLAFVPSQPTISIVLRQGGKPVKPRASKKKLEAVKPKLVKCPQVDRAMLQWLEAQIEKDEAVTIASVQTKAQELVHQLKVSVEGFSVSQDWVDSFMRHHVLQCPFGLSDSESTDAEEHEQRVGASGAAKKAGKTVKSAEGKAGKTSRRVVKVLVAKKDTRMPAPATVGGPPAGKRKRDGKNGELEKPAKTRR